MEYLVLGLTRGSMYALIALGYTLVYGVLQLINFAHSEVFMAGAFGSYLVVERFVSEGDKPPWYGVLGILILGLTSGALVGAIVAYLLERVAYRPLRKKNAPPLSSSTGSTTTRSLSTSTSTRPSSTSGPRRSR